MSESLVSGDSPSRILTEIWDEDDEEAAYSSGSESGRIYYESNDEDYTAPLYCQLPSPKSRIRSRSPLECDNNSDLRSSSRQTSSTRDRSPLRRDNQAKPGGVAIGAHQKDDTRLEMLVNDEFSSLDPHEVYARPEQDMNDVLDREANNNGTSERTARGRGRGVRRGSVCARRQVGGRRWAAGDPLQHIYVTDNELPPELVPVATDVTRKREDIIPRDKEKAQVLLEDNHLRFDWCPMDSFRGEEEIFIPKRTGATRSFSSAYEAFRSFWDNNILQLIVNETNEYAKTISSATFQSDWFPTNIDEILCLFAFWMMLGVIRMPTIKSCFSASPLLKTEVFRRILTLKRHDNLTRAFNLSEPDSDVVAGPSKNDSSASSDPLHYLRPILDHLNIKFKENYVLSKDICIDESITPWKGRLNFRQCVWAKTARFGIKTFDLCESGTGYLWSFLVYSGKEEEDEFNSLAPKSTSVVKKLMDPLLNKGYRLFMDNWFNSPRLARYLKLNKTDCVGSLLLTRQDVPVLLRRAALKQGEFIARHSGDVCVLTWQDKKRITMLSTCHGAETGLPSVRSKLSTRHQQFKPQMVLDYNKLMGGVDIKDQMLEPYLLERKRCGKWYIKLFKRLLNSSILNAGILLQSSNKNKVDPLHFRLTLVESILANHLSHCPVNRRRYRGTQSGTYFHPEIDHNMHWPIYMEPSEYNIQNNRKRRELCRVCLREGRKTQKTPFMCGSCKVPLCVVNCFKSFHS